MNTPTVKVEQYKGHPILCLPLGEGELKFGLRKAHAVIAQWDAVQAFATTASIPSGSPARIEDFKGQPILVLPVDGEDEFRFGQRKAQTILSHQQAVQAFAVEPPTPDEAPQPQPKPDEYQRRAAAFRQLADNMKKQIAEQRRPAFEGQRSTYRREHFRAAKADEARKLELVQDKLYALAGAWERGSVPDCLEHLTTRTQVERLTRCEIYPNPVAHVEHLTRLLNNTKGKRGTAAARRIVEQVLRRRESWFCRLYGREEMDAIDTLLKADPERKTYERHLRGNYEGAYQLLKGGIATPSDYSQAREALLALGDPQAGQKTMADIIADAERQLVGLKIPGFFPTPQPVVHRLLELADIVAGDHVLEPSAGKGNIADGVRQACPDTQLHTCEIQSSLREILKLKGYALVGSNFLDLEPDSRYDTVVMNPPFENFQDIQHVRHAYNFLKPGGRLVAVMGEGAFFRQDTIAAEFRRWLADNGGYEERLPEGSFKASGTGVAARIVVIDKPALQPSQPLPLEEKIEGFTQLSLF